MEQLSDSKLRKDYIKAIHYHPAYLTYMQSTSCEMLGRVKQKLKSRLPGEISITSDMQEKEMATHSGTLALKIPWTEELGAGYYPWGCKESGTIE